MVSIISPSEPKTPDPILQNFMYSNGNSEITPDLVNISPSPSQYLRKQKMSLLHTHMHTRTCAVTHTHLIGHQNGVLFFS